MQDELCALKVASDTASQHAEALVRAANVDEIMPRNRDPLAFYMLETSYITAWTPLFTGSDGPTKVRLLSARC